VVSGHRLDFTDRIRIGKNVIIAGRNSSLWTHNRQTTRPIEIGDFCYLGSEVRVAPGAALGEWSILGMGAVLSGNAAARTVHGGVPARPIRAITDDDARVLAKKTRKEIPEDLY
jgi:acetyltransferase-like isoleucine patch superfamily enzyme